MQTVRVVQVGSTGRQNPQKILPIISSIPSQSWCFKKERKKSHTQTHALLWGRQEIESHRHSTPTHLNLARRVFQDEAVAELARPHDPELDAAPKVLDAIRIRQRPDADTPAYDGSVAAAAAAAIDLGGARQQRVEAALSSVRARNLKRADELAAQVCDFAAVNQPALVHVCTAAFRCSK